MNFFEDIDFLGNIGVWFHHCIDEINKSRVQKDRRANNQFIGDR